MTSKTLPQRQHQGIAELLLEVDSRARWGWRVAWCSAVTVSVTVAGLGHASAQHHALLRDGARPASAVLRRTLTVTLRPPFVAPLSDSSRQSQTATARTDVSHERKSAVSAVRDGRAAAPIAPPSRPASDSTSSPTAGTSITAIGDAPVDFTGFDLAAGSHGTYETGPARSGAAEGRGTRRSVVIGRGTANAASTTVELSQGVRLESTNWTCPWPAAAAPLNLHRHTVLLRVTVGPEGAARSARLLQGDEHGFGAAALGCALGKRYTPARDAAGEPIVAESPVIRVRFER